jgi:ABC-type Fe3+ transport system, periplasmic component
MMRYLLCLVWVTCWILALSVAYADQAIVVYSARKDHLIKPLFDAYTDRTGIKVRFITDEAPALLQRLMAEGARTPADMLITVDAGNLWQAAEAGVLAPVDSPVLKASIPDYLRDPEKRWFGLSVRARTIVYSTERVRPEELSTYEDLGSPRWHGRLCLRTSKKVYNQSLVAMMIARLGEAKTEKIVRAWVENLATDSFSDDTKLIEAIAAGQCDVGIVNTYYFGQLKREQPGIPLALYWSNQAQGGVHVNVSGAGITRHAKNREQAVKLLEWLVTPEAQRLFADLNLEYPANPSVPPTPWSRPGASLRRTLSTSPKPGACRDVL